MTVFKAYDVRAIYPDPLSEEIAKKIGSSAGRLLLSESDTNTKVVIGYDMRLSSPSLVSALKDGLLEVGCDVVDVGLVDTPFIAFAVNHLNAIGGIQTTASHNPAHYNGFKICRAKAKPVGMGTGLEKIQALAEGREEAAMDVTRGKECSVDLWEAYKKHVFTYLDPRIESGELVIRAAVDASNGMAGTMVPKLFRDVKGLELAANN
jgi:phosphomannomutase